jgi:dihydrofolate synthase/folylpolyglutamate synthase
VRYAEAITRLYALSARGMRVGIERMRDGLAHRGLAEGGASTLRTFFIQVAGTNGKGSVSSMLASALHAAGYKTGLYSSPHLHRFTERVRIDGEPITTREAARRISELLTWAENKSAPELSFFELSTLLAVEAFRDHKCDVAVIEVGLGGRLDATTALPASLSVITRIALDHEQILGNTLAEIAAEKAGIIRPGVPVIVGARGVDVQRVIEARARELGSQLSMIDRDFRALPGRDGRIAFDVSGRRIPALKLGLAGEHQHDNAALAVAALCALESIGLPVSPAAISRGLRRVRWPARLERYPGRPAMLFDAAHNPDGCEALARYLAQEKRRPRVLVFGAMSDKNYPRMLSILSQQVEHIVYVVPNLARAASHEQLQACAPGSAANSAGDALASARAAAGGGGLVICAGSIFSVAELRAKALRLPSDPLIRM